MAFDMMIPVPAPTLRPSIRANDEISPAKARRVGALMTCFWLVWFDGQLRLRARALCSRSRALLPAASRDSLPTARGAGRERERRESKHDRLRIIKWHRGSLY